MRGMVTANSVLALILATGLTGCDDLTDKLLGRSVPKSQCIVQVGKSPFGQTQALLRRYDGKYAWFFESEKDMEKGIPTSEGGKPVLVDGKPIMHTVSELATVDDALGYGPKMLGCELPRKSRQGSSQKNWYSAIPVWFGGNYFEVGNTRRLALALLNGAEMRFQPNQTPPRLVESSGPAKCILRREHPKGKNMVGSFRWRTTSRLGAPVVANNDDATEATSPELPGIPARKYRVADLEAFQKAMKELPDSLGCTPGSLKLPAELWLWKEDEWKHLKPTSEMEVFLLMLQGADPAF